MSTKDLAERLWRDLCEEDDRTSPPDHPEMCLITFDEFSSFLRDAAAEENENCASLVEGMPRKPDPFDGGRHADEMPTMVDPSRHEIAAAIRTRLQEKP